MTIYQANRREVVFDINIPRSRLRSRRCWDALTNTASTMSATLTVEAARQRLASFVGSWQIGCSTINQCSRQTNHSSATSDTIRSM
jgi:hypothetical protein